MPAPFPVAGKLPHLTRYLSDDGTEMGLKNVNLNYLPPAGGIGPTPYFIQPPQGQVYVVERLTVTIVFTLGNDRADNYGGIVGGLANGMLMAVQSFDGAAATDIVDLLDGIPVLSHGGWGGVCWDVLNPLPSPGAGNDSTFMARWSFFKAGQPIRLRGQRNALPTTADPAERLTLVGRDDLTTLVAHRFMAQGYRES